MNIRSIRNGLAAAGATLMLALCGCGGGDDVGNSDPPGTAVRIETVECRSFADYFNLIGTVRGEKEATLVFEVGGVVEEILADQGSTVEMDAPLARLNDEVLRASLREVKAAWLLAKDLFSRNEALLARGAVSDFDLSRLQAEMEMALARYESARAQWERTTLRAPFAGYVDSRFLDVGDYALPMAPFIRLLDLRYVKVQTPVPEIYLARIHPGDGATITADQYPESPIAGTISFVSREVDSATRTVTAEISVDNSDNRLRPGMTVRVRLVKAAHVDAVVVPQDAVVETEEGPAVFLAVAGAAALRQVVIGTVYGHVALIQEGLAEGDSLIVIGNRDLVDGEKIEVLP